MARADRDKRKAQGVDRPQDPIVERIRPDPAKPPEPTLTLTGFLGDSDREGFRRLYFTRELDYYAEFRVEDVLDAAPIPANEHPFPGEEATRLSLRREAPLEYTRARTARTLDDFDLDVRLGAPRAFASRARAFAATGNEVTACGNPTGCGYWTCETLCPTACKTPTECETQCDTHCWTHCGPCQLPFTVEDPTCARTCADFTCEGVTPCDRIREPHPSVIETACVPQCADPR